MADVPSVRFVNLEKKKGQMRVESLEIVYIFHTQRSLFYPEKLSRAKEKKYYEKIQDNR